MYKPTLAHLAFALSLTLATACGAAPKHAESPDFTEKGWSGSSADANQAKADPPIQSDSTKSDEPKTLIADKIPAPSESKPETSSAAEADIVSGAALPKPPTPPKAAKPAKAKKPGKTRNKKTQAARG